VVPRWVGARSRRGVAVVPGAGDGCRVVAIHRRGKTRSQVTDDLLAGMWQLLQNVGAVSRTLLCDNKSGIGLRGRLAEGVAGIRGVLATRQIQTRPYDPESMELVERANGYLETSFLPGRTCTSLADFNAQLWAWTGLHH